VPSIQHFCSKTGGKKYLKEKSANPGSAEIYIYKMKTVSDDEKLYKHFTALKNIPYD